MKKIFGLIGFIWGFVGVSLILLHGITCVYPYVVTLDFSKMFWYHYLSLIISIIFLGYAEGYKGFQLSFSPRVAQRLKLVFKNPSFVNVVLSPLFCMGFLEFQKRE